MPAIVFLAGSLVYLWLGYFGAIYTDNLLHYIIPCQGVADMFNGKRKHSKSKFTKAMKPSSTISNDVEYVRDMGDDSESDHQQVATRSKKQHLSHYIAPLSVNKFANLAKQNQVIAPKVSQKFILDSNATKDKHFKPTSTMAELILGNKGPQRQKEVFKKKN
ncbi:hypothetical protein R6Q59_019852 [Mikania micrantha]